MSRPTITIKEQSIPSADITLSDSVIGYVVQSEKGKPWEFFVIESETDLVDTIGEPTADTAIDFQICNDLLKYGNNLIIVRAVDEDTAELPRRGIIGADVLDSGYDGEAITDSGDDKYFTDYNSHTIKVSNNLEFYAKSPQDATDLTVSVCKFTSGTWASNTTEYATGKYFNDIFEYAPDSTKEEILLVVLEAGLVVEQFTVSLKSGEKNTLGENEYIADYLDLNSNYIWGFAGSGAYTALAGSFKGIALTDGSKGSTPATGDFETAYAKFANKDDVTIDYIVDGSHEDNRAYIIDSIAEVRKDCIAFINCKRANILNGNVPLSNTDTITTNITTDRGTLTNSSWSAYYGNFKSIYDKYQDKDIWIPCSPSMAGLRVKVDTEQEHWISACGTTMNILNINKLAYQPTAAQQNTLYKYGVNHIYFKEGKGFIVDGQKTMTTQNIGVSRVCIRNLFRLAERYTANSLVDYLHKFNDAATRARIVSILNPYFKDILDRGGIVRYKIICDETNNTADVINSYGLRCSIIIEGKRPIEQIEVQFYDIPAGISFTEVV